MARRRFQNPKPVRRGDWWVIQRRRDHNDGQRIFRVNERVKLVRIIASNGRPTPEREARRIAAEYLRPLNQGLEVMGSVTGFLPYVEHTFVPLVMSTMASTTQERYRGIINNYLLPAFQRFCLRDLTRLAIQRYISTDERLEHLSHESRDKIRDVLSSILGSAVGYGLLVNNPVEGVRLPRDKRPKFAVKPHISPEQFHLLVELIPEPYATMVYVAVYSGLRVSELIGLRWEDVHEESLTVDERYCRGDWDVSKSECSNATIAVDRSIIERIHRLKTLTVVVKAGRATRHYKVVKSDGPKDLVFQSIKDGKPMRDNTVLTRFLKPAGRRIGLGFVNWRCLRTSYATWLKMAGADVKDAQAQLRHSRASTTLDIYQQFVPESQRKAVMRMAAMVAERQPRMIPAGFSTHQESGCNLAAITDAENGRKLGAR